MTPTQNLKKLLKSKQASASGTEMFILILIAVSIVTCAMWVFYRLDMGILDGITFLLKWTIEKSFGGSHHLKEIFGGILY